MNRIFRKQKLLFWLDLLGRGVLVLLFFCAAVPKLFNIEQFAGTIDAYAILPDIFLLPSAMMLPIVELVLAIGLLFNRLTSKIGMAVLLLFFISVLSYAILQGLDIDCGCFGPDDPEYSAFRGLRAALVRDILMLVPLIYSFWYHRYRYCLST
jgi:hypothetical protein